MLSSKHISKITITLMSVVLVLCILAMAFYDRAIPVINTAGYKMEYQDELFDTSDIINIDIVMDFEKWSEMLQNARQEEYYECNVVVNGTTFKRVGIRPKGNTSLSSIAGDPDNNRYSFKLEFDHFVDGQTCFGLDKIALNNSYADTTNMKEAVIYDMFQFLDADSPLCNYAKISVNNEYFGIYLAIEAIEESFMLRNYGMEKGYLYKPEGMGGGKNDNKRAQGNKDKSNAQGGFGGRGGFFGGMGGGSNLNYTNDNLDSYQTIWDGEVTDSQKADHKRVVAALKNVHERKSIEKHIDVEQVLKYMAVHNFSVNDDSLSGMMPHNYYLYEANGKISIVPWDYNLAFGGMHRADETSVINDPIDDSWQGTKLFDFVLENEDYKARYHEYYKKLTDEYLLGGGFEKTYNRIRKHIDELVKEDPNSMYTYDEYKKGADVLYDAVMLRAESVSGQLKGDIPSTTEGQMADSSSLINASHLNLSDLGQFMMGDFGGNRNNGQRKNP